MSSNNNFTKDLIVGGFAGGFSRTITSPLEITKMLQQNYPHSYGNQSVGRIIRNIYSTTGFKSLFKGNVINCTRIIPQNAIHRALVYLPVFTLSKIIWLVVPVSSRTLLP